MLFYALNKMIIMQDSLHSAWNVINFKNAY